MSKSPISTSEYRAAYRSLTQAVLEGFFRVDPLFSRLQAETTEHRGPMRVAGREGPIVQEMTRWEVIGTLSREAVENTDVDAIACGFYEMATQHRDHFAKHFFERMTMVVEQGGTTFDAGGRPFTFELMLEMLEAMPVTFDDDGKANLTLLVAPETSQAAAKSPPTAEQQARFDAILAKKKEAYDASRRTRRLPREGQ